jgi:hypothetical protein
MSRLTTRDKYGFAPVTSITKHIKVLEKLAYYEDLEEQLEKVYGEHNGLLETAVKSLVRHEGAEFNKPCKARLLTDEDVDKWETYKSLEEQGLLLKLPCKVGDTIYRVIAEIYEYKVTAIGIYENRVVICVDNLETGIGFSFDANRIGKRYFTTKAEAEKALEEMEK